MTKSSAFSDKDRWRTRSNRWRLIVFVTLFAAASSSSCNHREEPDLTQQAIDTSVQSKPQPTFQESVLAAERVLESGDLENASNAIRSLMISNSTASTVQILAARLALREERYDDSLELIREIDRSAQEYPQVEDLVARIAIESPPSLARHANSAWVSMESVLKRRPGASNVRKALIRLLNWMGHRHRACQHSDWLVATATADQEQLLGLLARRNSFPTSELIGETAVDVFQSCTEPQPALALARQRWVDRQYTKARELLEPYQQQGWPHPEHAALMGQILGDSQRFDLIPAWIKSCPEAVTRYPEYWSGVGHAFRDLDDKKAAAGAFLAAIEIDPTCENDYRQLAANLSASDQEAIERRAQGVQTTRVQAILSHTKGIRYLGALSKQLNDLGRPYEFISWQENLAEDSGAPASFMNRFKQQRLRLSGIRDLKKLALVSRRMGFTKEEYPAPNPDTIRSLAADEQKTQGLVGTATRSELGVEFVDVTQQVELNFLYQNHESPRLRNLRIHESLGGGIGVLDYDLDGRPDLYFNQAGGDPPKRVSERSSRLARNADQTFRNVTQFADAMDYGYGTGVAVGDVNQDGFPDLLIGQLGTNRLLTNQGDGTFKETHGSDLFDDDFTASVAIADVTGDHLPDIVETNYVGGQKMFIERVIAEGEAPAGTSPLKYPASADKVYPSGPSGLRQHYELESTGIPAASLGLIVGELNGAVGNEIFIANDAYPNRLWVRNDSTTNDTDLEMTDQAEVAGVSVDFTGILTAGMGVTTGDFNDDGMQDLHVTNFWQQSSSLFVSQSPGIFTDLAPRFGLNALTYPMLAFGTQSLDANSDGKLDLVILNGHIEDYSSLGHPFRMPAQVLVGDGREFRDTKHDAGYFLEKRLGRSLVKLDWNVDGRIDLCAGHLASPVTLLQNNQSNDNWIEFHLVGKTCERDAIGACVRVQTPNGTFVRWLNAGDGYMSSNERIVHVTLGEAREILEVRVEWPDGIEQSIKGLELTQRYLIVQGDPPELVGMPDE